MGKDYYILILTVIMLLNEVVIHDNGNMKLRIKFFYTICTEHNNGTMKPIIAK
jgi:hypothetical protein